MNGVFGATRLATIVSNRDQSLRRRPVVGIFASFDSFTPLVQNDV